ncbi:MAG: PAS domain S-box protein, partial [Candidatus Neomarinimicrobiota bacterium]
MINNKSGLEIKKLIEERDSAQKYLDIAEVIFLILNNKGYVTLINNKGCKVLGYNKKDITGKNWFKNFLPASTRNDVTKIFKKILNSKIESVEFSENRILTRSGRERLIAWHNSKLLDDDGKIIGTLSSGIDITDQRLAEQRFKQVVESSPNGIIMVNDEGKIMLVNCQIDKLFGYNRHELIGQSVEILVPKSMRIKHIDFRKSFFLNPETRRMGKGRDLFAIRKDGTQFPVEIGLSTIETDSGIAVLSSIVDITERKKAEKILQDSEEKLQAILDNTTDAILVYNEVGKIITINNQARNLFAKNERKLANVSNIIPPDQISIHQFQLDKAKNGTNLLDYETERILSNGERIFVSVALSYMPGEDGMYIETTRDISERVIMRNKIIDFEKAQIIANMAEGIAHHMGTPLASMLLRIQMLKEDMEHIDKDNKFIEKLESVEKQIFYGQKVMQRLLKFASKPLSQKQPFSIKNIANDTVEILRPLLNKKRIKLVIDIDEDYTVLADGNMIQLVFSDLIINSIHAIEDEGIIKISANKDESNENLIIKISDTGIGIPEEVIPYVFEPFYTTKTAEKGTGLGLAVAKRIIHEHDGEIRIESKKNEGTEIII